MFCIFRIEKVIEELENIKETVAQKPQGEEGALETARPDSVTPLTARFVVEHSKMTCVPSKDTDQPGHSASLMRVFTVHLKKVWVHS